MGRALAAFLTGCFMTLVALCGRRDVARARGVPRSARMMGDRGTLDDWKTENLRAATAMLWMGAVMVAAGVALAIDALLA
jgi:hypothetical protein